MPPIEGALRAALFRVAQIVDESHTSDGEARIRFHLEARVFEQLRKAYPQFDHYLVQR